MRSAILLAVAVVLPAAANAQQPCTSDGRRVVDAIYQQILERQAGGEGAEMVEQLSNGRITVRELVREVAKSPEHRQRFLSTNDREAGAAVGYLYKHLLGRDPDQGGAQAHARTYVNNGPEPVIDNLVNSPEYLRAYGDDTVPGSRVRYCGTAANRGATGRIRFQGMDRNGDSVISREEWNGSRQSFAIHDWNGDGQLSGEEVRPGARRAIRAAEENDFERFSSVYWTPEEFRSLDRNRDNRITSNEWYYEAESFRRADRNRDGALTLAEFTSADDNMDDDRVDSFDNLDLNRNGRLERSEWHGSADAFQWLDRNRDNVLSRTEVVGDDAALNSRFDNFSSLDANGNGTLSFEEWHWSRRSFNRYDANQDGVITRREFAVSGGAPETVR